MWLLQRGCFPELNLHVFRARKAVLCRVSGAFLGRRRAVSSVGSALAAGAGGVVL